MADSDPNKLSVEEQVARIKAAKEAAKLAAAEKAAAQAAEKAAVAPTIQAAVAASKPPVPAAPPVAPPVAKAPPPAPAPAAPIAPPPPPAPVAVTAPSGPPPAPGSVEEQVAKIKAAKAAAAEKGKAVAAAKTGTAVGVQVVSGSGTPTSAPDATATPPAAAPLPGSVEEKVAQIKAAKAAAAAKGAATAPATAAKVAAGTAAVAAAAAAAPPGTTPPGTPEAIARAAAAHEKAQGASAIYAHGTPVNKPAVQLLAAAKPGAAKAAAKKNEPELPLPPPPQLIQRRRALGFLSLGTTAWVIFFAWLAGTMHLFLRFMYPNVLYEADPKFNAGRRNDFPESPKVYENYKQSQAVWIVRLTEEGQDRLVALSTVCTHLGCTPNWLETEQKYKCPCHGSGYYINGVNFEGPTPRPLERFRIYMDATGNIIVDKAKKYRQDLQQWNENQSYLNMA